MGNAQYYYLDDSNRPQGPFTVEQLAALMLSGTVTQETKVAAAGDSNWKPVSEQTWFENGQVKNGAGESVGFARGGVGVEPGACPKCGKELTGWSVPLKCPHCGYQLRPNGESFWANMLYAGRQLFTLRGRATRKEYWAFTVGMIPIFLLWLFLLAVGLAIFLMELDFDSESEIELLFSVWPKFGMLMVVTYGILCIPCFFLLGRRLHDLGKSAWWSGLMMLISVAGMYMCIPAMEEIRMSMEKPLQEMTSEFIENQTAAAEAAQRLAAAAREKGDEALAREIEEKNMKDAELAGVNFEKKIDNLFYKVEHNTTAQLTTFSVVSGLLSLVNSLCSIIILVLGCIDSRRGPNKYGPSIKYPRG
ncbi:MAG: DUF805 domain-containing protein [Akkermansia sp.]|nr:DUF805 domain-containing protein [Akkermansia sp.]